MIGSCEKARTSLADHYYDSTLARLVLPQPTIAPVLATVGRLHIAAEEAAIDLRPFTFAADWGVTDFGGHRLAHGWMVFG